MTPGTPRLCAVRQLLGRFLLFLFAQRPVQGTAWPHWDRTLTCWMERGLSQLSQETEGREQPHPSCCSLVGDHLGDLKINPS